MKSWRDLAGVVLKTRIPYAVDQGSFFEFEYDLPPKREVAIHIDGEYLRVRDPFVLTVKYASQINVLFNNE